MFGFRTHASAALARWQAQKRDEMKGRVSKIGLPSPFIEDMSEEEEEDEDEDEDEVVDVPVAGGEVPIPGAMDLGA